MVHTHTAQYLSCSDYLREHSQLVFKVSHPPCVS